MNVLQIRRCVDDSVVDEMDVTGYSEARVKRLVKMWQKDIHNGLYIKHVENKVEHNGL